MLHIDTLFFIIATLSFVAIFVFAALAIVHFVKKERLKGKKQIKLTGISIGVMIISFIIFAITTEPSTTVEDKEKVETAAKTNEEKTARETKEAEEKVLAEQKAKEEAKAKADEEAELKAEAEEKAKVDEEARLKAEAEEKAKVESPVVSTWQDKVKEVATMDGSPTEKYDAIMLYAKEYPSTEIEIKEFEDYIVTEYQNKRYIADITNSEYMIGNIFRANVINRFYGQVNSPMNDFAFDFYQNTKYTYRGVDTIDSAATRANERQMDKALKKM